MSQQPSDALHDPTTSDGGLGISDYPTPHTDRQSTVDYALTVNGREMTVTDAWIGESLLYALRERLGLPGSKNACEQGECGSCSALLDGRLVATCCVLAADAVGSDIRTVEGLASEGELTDVQRAFVEQGAVQCGFCIPGHGRRHPRSARSQRPGHGAGVARGDLRKSVPLHRLRPDLRCVPPSTGGTDQCRRLACHPPSPASAARRVSARAYCDPTRRRRPRGGSRSRLTCGWTACCGARRCAARSRTRASRIWTRALRCSSPACTRSSPTTTCGAAAPTVSNTTTSRSSRTRWRCSTASRLRPSPRTIRRSLRGPSRRSRSSTTCSSRCRIPRWLCGRRRETSTPTATCSATSGCGTVTRAPSARSSSRAATRSARRTRRSSARSRGWRCPARTAAWSCSSRPNGCMSTVTRSPRA